MTDTPLSAGRTGATPRWPTEPGQLVDTTLCPACFVQLAGPYCSACNLDLRDARASDLLARGRAVIDAEGARQALIAQMRVEQDRAAQAAAQRSAAALAAQQAAAVAQHVAAAGAQQAAGFAPAHVFPDAPSAVSAAAAPPQPPTEQASPSHTRRHSSVQIMLLVTGVSLVSVAAIFFLTVAWVLTGLAARSTIVAAATAAALLVAALLRRRRLTATAEGIGTFGVVLVLLDLWATRANDLFGAADSDALAYWGVGMLVCAAVFFSVHFASGIRVAGFAAFVLTPLAIGLVFGAVAAGLGTAAQIVVASLGAALATGIVAATVESGTGRWLSEDRVPERIALYGILLGALGVAMIAAGLAAPDVVWAPLGWYLAVAVVAAGHAALAVSMRRPAALGGWLGGIAVVAVCSIAAVVVGRDGDGVALVTSPALTAVVIALGLEVLVRALRSAAVRAIVVPATVPARVIAGCWLAVTAVAAATPLAQAVGRGATMTRDPFVQLSAVNVWALFVLAAVGTVAAGCWAAIGRLRTRLSGLSWYGAGLILVAVAFLVALPAVLAGFVAVAAIGWALSIVAARPRVLPRIPLGPSLALMIAAQTAAFVTGFASSATWWVGAVSGVLICYGSRFLARGGARSIARPLLAGVAAVLGLTVAGVAPWALSLAASPGPYASLDNVVGGVTLGVAVLAILTALPWRRFLRPAERAAIFWTLTPFSVLFLYPTLPDARQVDTNGTVLLPEPIGAVARTALLAAACVVWIVVPHNRRGARWQRRAAAAALPPALSVLAALLAQAAGANPGAVVAAIAGSALVGFALGLLTAVPRNRPRPGTAALGRSVWATDRWRSIRAPLDGGAAAVLLVALILAVSTATNTAWFVVLLSAVALLMAAITADGLFAAASWRGSLKWGAVVLGTVALWMRLSAANIDLVEAYVVPPALVLITMAWCLHRFGSPRLPDEQANQTPLAPANTSAAATLLLAGLLLAAGPVSLAGITGSLVRPFIVIACATALVLYATAARWTVAKRWYLVAAGVPAALSVLLTACGRAARTFGSSPVPLSAELWLAFAGAVFCAGGALVIRRLTLDGSAGAAPDAVDRRIVVAPALVGVGLVIGLLSLSLRSAEEPASRAAVVFGAAAVVAVGATVLHARPQWRATARVAIALTLSAACITAGERILGLFGSDGPADGRVEGWMLPASSLLAVTAVLLTSTGRRVDAVARPRSRVIDVIAQALLIVAVCAALVTELAATGFAPLTTARVLVLTWGFSAVHAAVFLFDRRPFTPLVGWVTLAAAAVAAVVGAPLLAPTPFEVATVPVAAALLVSGGLRLMRTPAARSWPWLGLGVAMLLIPSLIVGFWDAPLWRIVALGIAAVGAILLGLMLRLQSPFLIGCAVALVHALVQLWPWIAAAYQATQWWLWVGVGGALLIAVAARYERRIRDVKTAVTRISALR